MMAYLSQLWSTVSAPDKLTWDTIATSRSISAFNAFVSENLLRWQTNAGVTQAYPAAEVNSGLLPDDTAVDGVILASSGADGYAEIGATPDGAGASDAVAVVIFRADAAPTPLSWAKAVKILAVTPSTPWTYTDSPLVAGTYHYKIAYISDDGCISVLSAADNQAVVT